MNTKKFVIKIGTNVITRSNGLLDLGTINQIVQDIAHIKKKGVDVVLVSSGAMGAGRGLVTLSKKMDEVSRRQVLAAVGQAELIRSYQDAFRKHQLICAQVLATKEDFRSRRHYLNMRNCFESLLQENVIPIVNENDVVSVDELMFTDNDELAGLIASMLQADKLILLTSVDGVLDSAGNVIPEIQSLQAVKEFISTGTSSFGRGGMATKCRMAEKLSKLGIDTVIANGTKDGVLPRVLNNEPVGTVMKASGKKASRVKQWIAQSEGRERGQVTLNDHAEKVLRDTSRVASLLPIGITKVDGRFIKGDLIKIVNAAGQKIGYGVAQFGARQARERIGRQGEKPFIHYDYLYIHD